MIRDQNDDSIIRGIDYYDAVDHQVKKPASVPLLKNLSDIAAAHAKGRESSFYGMKFLRDNTTAEDVQAFIVDVKKGIADTKAISGLKNKNTLFTILEAGIDVEREGDASKGSQVYSLAILRLLDLGVKRDEIISKIDSF